MGLRERPAAPCWKCEGSGMGSRYGAKCRRCAGTGDACERFRRQWRDRGYTENPKTFELGGWVASPEPEHFAEEVDDAIHAYVEAVYPEWSKRGARVLTILQNCVDHVVAESVWRLASDPRALFVWLRAQDILHCPQQEEDEDV